MGSERRRPHRRLHHFSLDAYSLWERGEQAAAIGYVLGSLVLSFTVLAVVVVAARRFG